MNEQKTTLAAYKEYLLKCAEHDSLNYEPINELYEYQNLNYGWFRITLMGVITLDTDMQFRLKKRTVVVNGQTVPAPTIDRVPNLKEIYYVIDLNNTSCVCRVRFEGFDGDKKFLRAGWFDNEQDASEYFKALLGIK